MAARKLAVYNAARAELVAFEKKYDTIVLDCTTTPGMKAAKDCRREIRDARSNLEDLRKEAKTPVLEKGKQIDAEAKAIKAKLDTLFSKFDTEIKAIENAAEIAKQAELDEALAKVQALDAREAAIIAKEIELGIREAEPEEADEPSDDSSDDSSRDSVDSIPESGGNLAQPHIDQANDYLTALRTIRKLIEPTDPQPDSGEIDDKIAVQHDQVLAEVWDVVDELT